MAVIHRTVVRKLANPISIHCIFRLHEEDSISFFPAPNSMQGLPFSSWVRFGWDSDDPLKFVSWAFFLEIEKYEV